MSEGYEPGYEPQTREMTELERELLAKFGHLLRYADPATQEPGETEPKENHAG